VFSRSRWVACSDGRGFSCGVVILCGGARFRSLGLPAEERLRGRGIIDCTPCDAGFYAGKPVVVVGSDAYAVGDALHLTRMGARVTLLTQADRLETERELAGVEVRCGARVEAIVGEERVERVVFSSAGAQQDVAAAGIAVRIGLEPNTGWLVDLVDLDSERRIPVDAGANTDLRFVVAAGDIRSGTSLTIAGAVADGRQAAARASELLSQIG